MAVDTMADLVVDITEDPVVDTMEDREEELTVDMADISSLIVPCTVCFSCMPKWLRR
jgi:hypothetical protein